MKMSMRTGLLMLALCLVGPVVAQTPTPDEEEALDIVPEAAAEASEEATAAADEEEEELPDIDIWSEDAADDEDVFIPTERISADSNIAYPADI